MSQAQDTTWTLEDLEGLREGWDFEAKKAAGRDGAGALPRALWETYSAMANTRGGQVVLGLNERADGSFTLLIHADYEGRISIQAVKSPEAFVFRNPGTLRVPVSDVRRGGTTDCRNRALQRMFMLIGAGEQAGSGFGRILTAWHEQHWRFPLIEENAELDTTTLRLSMASLFPDEIIAKLQARFPGRFSELDEDGRLALATAEALGTVTNAQLQAVTSAHPRDLTVPLQRLVGDGFLDRHGQGRGAWYTVAEPSQAAPQTTRQTTSQRAADSTHKGPDSTHKGPDSTHKGPDSTHKGPDSTHKGPDSTHKGPDSTHKGPDSTHTGIIERVAASRRAPKEDLKLAILEFCRGEFRTAQAIASRLNRTPRTIQQSYLWPMSRDGQLRSRHPDAPNRPDQAYPTVEQDPGGET